MNVIDCAIKMEEEARLFYQALAANAPDPEEKNLFTMLAQAEQEHHDALVQVQLDAGPDEMEFKALDQAACVFTPQLSKRDLLARLKREPTGYRLVVEQEERGVQFYEELATRAGDERSRKLLLRIADQERKHLSIVENIYAFVESPKTFLASGEFSNLKEY
jgi:rubrerythrin